MTGKEAKGFFADKFKQSLKKDMIFWISLILSIVFFVIYYTTATWYVNFIQFIRFNWTLFGLWIGALFLVTRKFADDENMKSHNLKSICRIFLLVLMFRNLLLALIILPALGVWMVIEANKKRSSNEEISLDGLEKPNSKLATASLICSGLAVPLLVGITTLQGIMISAGRIHRLDPLASTGIGFLVGLMLAIAGIVLWSISRKQEGRHKLNFWAMRIIIVNVILAPFVLFIMFAVAITRAK